MTQGFLIIPIDGQESKRVPIDTMIIIGRAEDCDVVLNDAIVSRRHGEVWKQGNDFFWRDLNSQNGIYHNGRLLREGCLTNGDRLAIGQTVLTFQTDSLDIEKTLPNLEAQQIDPGSELLLEAVYSVMDEIATNLDPCSLQDSILETTLRAVHGQRGAILFAGGMAGGLAPCSICHNVHVIQDGHKLRVDLDAIQISNSVAKRVLEGGESVLCQDPRNVLESAAALGLESILCVPLRTQSGILGILYVDTNRANLEYNDDHLRLCSAVGASAGLAIENARMHTDILRKQRIEQEIAHAWTIQQGFLIKNWALNDTRLEAYGEMRPAEVVGGDFYDMIHPNADTVGLLIGDVSGKGISASLTMAQLLAQFRAIAQREPSPARVLAALNDDMYLRSQQGAFCSVCYMTLDLTSGRLLYANAGHLSPIQITLDAVHSFGEASGPPLGIMPTGSWVDTTWQVMPGDTIFMYTDGILEARCGTVRDATGLHDEFGLDGVCRVAQRMYGESPKTLIEALTAAVVAYCIPNAPHDDCTSIAMRYLGCG